MSTIEPGSAVRFESECVVIPDAEHRSRRPRVVTKSYAVPLWKKRTSYPTLQDDEDHQNLVLRLPLPTFSRKHHSTGRFVDHTPLPPCLVHRALLSDPSCSAPSDSPARHTRTPRRPLPSPSRTDTVTVPLRPCCVACQPVTEAATVGGDAWPERFSRAASRRRSLSADGSPRKLTVAASAAYGNLGLPISVDEIDKRRRSSDTGPSTSAHEASDDARATGGYRLLPRFTASVADARPPPSPTRLTPATPGIPEEDDEDEDKNELFPLPSPKRTPSTSPSPSPVGSISSLMVTQTNPTSTVSLTSSSCSGDSPSKRDFLAPPPCASSSSLSLPRLSESITDLTHTEEPEPPSPSLLSTFPTLSGRPSRSSSPRISFIPPTPTDASPSTTDRIIPKSPADVIPSSPSLSQVSSSPTHPRFPWRSARSISADISRGSPPSPISPTPSTSTASSARKSFSISIPRHVIADVLRGVGAMGVGGVGPPGM